MLFLLYCCAWRLFVLVLWFCLIALICDVLIVVCFWWFFYLVRWFRLLYCLFFDLDWMFGLCIDLLFCFFGGFSLCLVCLSMGLVFEWVAYLWCHVGCNYLRTLFALFFAGVCGCGYLTDICLLFNSVAGAVVSFGLNLSFRGCVWLYFVYCFVWFCYLVLLIADCWECVVYLVVVYCVFG